MTFTEFLQRDGEPVARYLEYKAHRDGVGLEETASRSLGTFSEFGPTFSFFYHRLLDSEPRTIHIHVS